MFHVEADDSPMANNPQAINQVFFEPTHTGGYFGYNGSTKLGVNTALMGYDSNNTTSTGGNLVEDVGVFGKAERTESPSGNTQCIGVKGFALGSSNNIGGVFWGDGNGTIGKMSSGSNLGFNQNSFGVWASASGNDAIAGYFNGKLYSTANFQNSDETLMLDIVPLTYALNKIKLLQPKLFTFNTMEFRNLNLPQGTQMGLKAQDIEKIMPELVTEIIDLSGSKNEDGKVNKYKSINYTNLIPLLITGVQEQQDQIEKQTKEINQLKETIIQQQQLLNSFLEKQKLIMGLEAVTSENDETTMSQNIPNPFSHETKITFELPKQITKAYISVYNLEGKEIISVPIIDFESNSVIITSDKLVSGIYIYSIIADGKVFDTKKMIIAKNN